VTARRASASLAVLALAIAPVMAAAADGGKPARMRPQGPAAIRFGPAFPVLQDSEWHFRLGGFGGLSPHAPLHHVPVILVHGNNVDAADWYPVRDDFRAAGWSDQELYAISYNGLGANNGTAAKRSCRPGVTAGGPDPRSTPAARPLSQPAQDVLSGH